MIIRDSHYCYSPVMDRRSLSFEILRKNDIE